MGEGSRVAALFKVEQQRVIAVHHTDQVITAVVIVFDAALFCTQAVAVVLHCKSRIADRNGIKDLAVHLCKCHAVTVAHRFFHGRELSGIISGRELLF